MHKRLKHFKETNEVDKDDYLESGGMGCPVCGDWDIEGGSLDVQGDIVVQHSHCSRCGAEWADTFTLGTVNVTNAPDEDDIQEVIEYQEEEN